MEKRFRSRQNGIASPSISKFSRREAFSNQLHVSSTPAGPVRPLPEFIETNNKLFQFRNHKPFHSKALAPKSPVKSAPPISRVFPHRQWAPEKAHAVSFRECDGESHLADSAIQSRFYDSERSELYFEQCFTIEKKLGEGSFGEVMKVRSLDNGKRYAVKRSREKFRNEADRMRKLDEVKKHEQLPKHPNCVGFEKAWEENHRLYIQTELCSMSLQEYWESKGSILEDEVWGILIDLLKGLCHIHKHGFIHLDIKPANIFISDAGEHKIGDFGLVIEHTDINDAREGDNKYMAPELLNSVFSTKADVYSLGIAILELASNIELPRDGISWRLLRQGYLPPECAECLSPDLCSIIQWMMTPDHSERPSISEVLSHPIVMKKRQKAVPLLVYKFCVRYCITFLFTVLNLLIKVLVHPFTIILRPISRPSIQKSKSHTQSPPIPENSHNYRWESTDSNELHSSSSNEGSRLHGSGAQQPKTLYLTPNVKTRSCSRYTPTPRNSSPVAHRVKMVSSVPNISPNLSPLSHSRVQPHYLNSFERNRSQYDQIDCFLSDISDTDEKSVFCNESLLVSKPRNLLDMLNNVSDSDTSFQE